MEFEEVTIGVPPVDTAAIFSKFIFLCFVYRIALFIVDMAAFYDY